MGKHLTAVLCHHHLSWITGSILLFAATTSQVAAQTIVLDETFKNTNAPNWSAGNIPPASGFSINPCLTATTSPFVAMPPQGPLAGCPTPDPLDPVGAGVLKLTFNTGNQSAFVFYGLSIPSTQGLKITFDYYSYSQPPSGLPGADGTTFFLFDANTATPVPGGFGGSLGYAQRNDQSGVQNGIPNGYVGIGLDEYGNFSNDSQGRGSGNPASNCPPSQVPPTGTSTTLTPNQVVIRGSGNGQSGYCWLAQGTVPGGLDFEQENRPEAKSVEITLDTSNRISISVDDVPIVTNVQLPPPPTAGFKLGFASSTGSFNNNHEIQNLLITTLVSPEADLSIAKTDNLTTAKPGDTITYTIVATSTGPAVVSGASVTDDTLPSQLENATWTCTATTGSSCNAATGSGNINTTVNLIPNGAATFTVTATVKAGATGTIQNTANVALPANSGLTDPNPGNNSATDNTTIPATTPDLIIQKTHTGNFIVGKQGVYTLSVSNLPTSGPTTGSVTVQDTLPNGLSFVSATGTNWNCSASGQIVTCTYAGSVVAAGENLPAIALRVNVDSAATGNITNSATVTTPGDDPNDPNNPNKANNTANDPTTVNIGPITFKSVRFLRDNDNTGTLTSGDDIQYTIIVENPSSNTAAITGVVISDTIPTQLQVLQDGSNTVTIDSGFVLSPSLPSSSFNGTGNSVTFTQPGTLNPGNRATLTFNTRILPNSASPVANQGSVNYTGDAGTPVLTDASDSTNPTEPGSGVNPGTPGSVSSGGNVNQPNDSNADPTIINFVTPLNPSGSKSVRLAVDADGSGSLTNGDILEYTVTYTNNNSTSVISNFLVIDPLPSSLSFVPGSYIFTATNGFAAANNNTTVTANLNFNGTTDTNLSNPNAIGQLGAGGGRVTIKFRAQVVAAAGTSISNQALATLNGGTLPPGSSYPTDAVSGPGDLNQGTGGGNNDPTQLVVAAGGPARLRLVKRITRVNATQYANFVPAEPANPNETAFPNFAQLLLGVPKLGGNTPLISGDEVEYTIYFLSDGGSPVNNVRFCDAIPTGTTFISDSFGLGAGILVNRAGITASLTNAADADAGTFFSSLAPLAAGNACPNQGNPDGAIIVNLGSISNTASNNFGFVRFRIKIN
nr:MULTISPECIES: isopeptide-forming domain-containing fimbrial protein [unclassified Coleofasciculus]